MSKKFRRHEEKVGPPELPSDIATLLKGYTFFKLVRNYPTPSNVYRVFKEGELNLFLKVGRDFGSERDRLSWLKGKLMVPHIVAYTDFRNQEYLLLTEISGLPADDDKWLANIAGLIEIIADEIHKIHTVSKNNCPFNESLYSLMIKAETVVSQKLLDSSDLSESYRHLTINNLYNNLLQIYPANESIVFTHGDLCLPNILIRQCSSAGFVDLGLAGLSDSHRDLALITRSIRSNFGEKWVRFFFNVYGQDVDEQKIEFYTLLDQFIMKRLKLKK